MKDLAQRIKEIDLKEDHPFAKYLDVNSLSQTEKASYLSRLTKEDWLNLDERQFALFLDVWVREAEPWMEKHHVPVLYFELFASIFLQFGGRDIVLFGFDDAYLKDRHCDDADWYIALMKHIASYGNHFMLYEYALWDNVKALPDPLDEQYENKMRLRINALGVFLRFSRFVRSTCCTTNLDISLLNSQDLELVGWVHEYLRYYESRNPQRLVDYMPRKPL